MALSTKLYRERRRKRKKEKEVRGAEKGKQREWVEGEEREF